MDGLLGFPCIHLSFNGINHVRSTDVNDLITCNTGDHEYIDVVNYTSIGTSERLIIDIDFRSHSEIARAVDS
jgi:uncharacterized protein (TIGR01615 family)